ncbi:MAG: hypothetical protein JSW34_03360 [Candidatus Zixiibacteriota bacterium]|nr:MAG: hypothetical protein JSW34_03360 [candidate division Zixibacteria bacterium]
MSRRSISKVSLAVVLVTILTAQATIAQEETGVREFGISAAVQSGQLDLMFPIWTSPKFVTVPSVYFAKMSDIGTDLGFGLLLRLNLRDTKAVPYLGFRAAVFIYKPDAVPFEDDPETATDFLVGPAFGGEYFLDDHFSVGVEGQVNITLSDEDSFRFGNPDDVNINTATAIMATFYF